MSAQRCFTCGRVTYADPPFCSQACADEFDPPDRTFPTAACGGPEHGDET